MLDRLGPAERDFLISDWPIAGRPDQIEPDGDWHIWMLLGGRGAGKTRAGAEWVAGLVRYARAPLRIALVGPSLGEARSVMLDGVSGILSTARPDFRPRHEITRGRLVWPDGSIAEVFSAEDPESLRGPQFHYAWCDELAKWRYAAETWSMLQFALRLGERPRQAVTTTPRPLPLLRELMNQPGTIVTRSRTRDNAANLAPAFLTGIEHTYGGTRIGRQELDGELISDDPDALFRRDVIERNRLREAPPLSRIVVAIDPPVTGREGSNGCGIICAGRGSDGRAYVLDDASLPRATPAQWAARAIDLYHAREADCLLAEVNQGGDLVAAVLREIDPAVPVKTVHATRGKRVRAEPVAALYEQGRIIHAGAFPALEDELAAFETILATAGKSPDRADALVWAVTDLLLAAKQGAPRIRPL